MCVCLFKLYYEISILLNNILFKSLALKKLHQKYEYILVLDK